MRLIIEIRTFGKSKFIYADDETNQFTINDTVIKKGATEFIRTALDIIKNWPEKLVAEEGRERDRYYKITFEESGALIRMEADGDFPEDFYKLSNLIFAYEDPVLFATQQMKLKQILPEMQ